jgi:nucleotide-binding universal stress UspA family protein
VDKLTTILAVIDSAAGGRVVFDKALCLAKALHASVQLLVLQPTLLGEFHELRAAHPQAHIVPVDSSGPAPGADDLIMRHAQSLEADLIVKHASAHSLRRMTLNISDWHLAHECPTPLLLVRDQPWNSPPRFAAAVDVADDRNPDLMRAILHAAGFLTLECEAELDVLYSERERFDGPLRMERAVRLARLVREFRVGGEHIEHLAGEPESTLPPVLRQQAYDCIVIGSARNDGLTSFKPGVTSRMFEATPGDVLFVHATGLLPTRNARRPLRTAAAL